MNEQEIKLSIDEVNQEKINFLTNVRIFAYSLLIIPATFATQLFFTVSESIKIPNNVIDSLVFHEKMKQLIRRKHHAYL